MCNNTDVCESVVESQRMDFLRDENVKGKVNVDL